MTEALYRLVYVSQNAVAGGDAALQDEIEQILETSRRNNRAAGITGALMYNAGCFTQILEGDRAALNTLFERIQYDTRHGDVTVLEFSPVESRDFADWSMGFVGRGDAPIEALKGLIDDENVDAATLPSREIYQAVYSLMKQEHASYA